MSPSSVRLIATDLDGTLLRSDGSVSERIVQSVRGAIDAGIEVVPATGRPRMIAEEIISKLDFVDHWIFANGSVTWHLGRSELIRGFWLDAEQARSLIRRLRATLPNVGFAIELDETVLWERGFEAVVPELPVVDPIVDVADLIEGRVQKILVFDSSKNMDELFTAVSSLVGDEAVPSYSGLAFVELAASLVTKATAIELLARDLGFARDDVVAFGDNHNDISMLDWAGHSYAMANATDDAKEAANELIGSNDEDAVADKIDELVAEARSR